MAPNRTTRRRALDRTLEKHSSWERRTLADLTNAGWKFSTIEKARQFQRAQITLEAMHNDQLVQIIIKHTEGK